ncbi:hypothetical protein [Burkholderia ubonensis]|uniref:hypothetical protein n=1 Tax=Burkholderia ubonensis TaxID=101571 RepID=UPI0005D79DB4|nr:hypothetical protein [Burkholderia ubonensis]AJX14650.1 hypothetical protein BW23_6173 [Burkholderia ubonensis MSMB22]
MTNSNISPVGTMMCGADQPTQDAQCMARKISFIFYCAPRDDGGRNPMYTAIYGHDATYTGVTDSASYLTGLPYVVVDADTHKVIYPYDGANGKTAKFGAKTSSNGLHDGTRNVHALPPINIPNDVTRIALHIANDAFHKHRNFQLFSWVVPSSAHSKVHIYEMRSDLQDRFSTENQLGSTPAENSIVAKPGASDEYFGYLNGDLWLKLSHEFTDDEIAQLCPPETLSRTAIGSSAQGGSPQSVTVDWSTTLRPIYGAGENSRSMDSFNVQISALGITLKFAARAVANAINTSTRTTVQQALRRTSPRAFAAILKAAWRLNIDTVDLSSSWRPMLGSRLHKMGVGLDVTQIVDSAENINFSIRNHSHADRNHPFPTSSGGQKISRLYQELNGDNEVSAGAVYTPWVNWVEPHDTHMHITVKYE